MNDEAQDATRAGATDTDEAAHAIWMAATRESLAGYRNLIDRTVSQLSDEQLFQEPAPGLNSVATILRHLGGNLQSRWTDFLTSDGEKESRNRDREFDKWDRSRDELLAYFEQGWSCLMNSLDEIDQQRAWRRSVTIRGESHSVPAAIQRSATHLAYHVGQLLMIGRWVFGDDERWQWLSIAPGKSQQHNRTTWGTAGSRAAMGDRENQ